ncbi:MAG: hypothetical protein GTO45_24755 [Candidatus Aminicenantes bacterium]|nr:hypothetical protein [Candidatus Aminicenantes bacterium]NIM77666.1 hypothetical protein [Candidatus Aminicenantes bacterium]NIN21343.1 hypothetical protein [Candidatus Aminicenantes bacterium]NIN45164.1 hypothetical protein [Candidatus Aminicenantes bacterium]NIN87981.1 hypothetical protein [Candidatus Aminicenantes bacterium]
MKMKKFLFLLMMLILMFQLSCSSDEHYKHYLSLSRYTDPKGFSTMLDELPDDVTGICEISKQQMVHHNLLIYHGVPYNKRNEMRNTSPPKLSDILKDLKETKPYNLYDEREIEQRVVGSCTKESHFLAGLLRYKGIPARPRAGYFKDVIINNEHFINFWETNFRGRGIMRELLEENPKQWKEEVNAILMRQIKANKCFEHWICEYWDKDLKKWRILDANTTFLKAAFDIEVGFHLPDKHWEYAYESWQKMRNSVNFNPDQYREDEQDGPSHIRGELLLDFYNLLNHDLTGFYGASDDAYTFIKGKVFADISAEELSELDELAILLSQNPTKEELVAFYHKSKTIKLEVVEKDPYSFVFK